MPVRDVDHPLYSTWKQMRYRCSNPDNKDYPRYGGRGIKVSGYWDQDFLHFAQWAATSGWQPGLTLDRIDNDGPYGSENCRWVARKEQSNNRQVTRRWEYYGVMWTTRELFDYFNPQVSWITFRRRLYQGWPIEQALMYKKNGRYQRNAS